MIFLKIQSRACQVCEMVYMAFSKKICWQKLPGAPERDKEI